MSLLTTAGKEYLRKIMRGDFSAGLVGLDEIVVYGSVFSVNEPDEELDSGTPSWSVTGSTYKQLNETNDLSFTIGGTTYVKGFVVYAGSDVGSLFGTDEIFKEIFSYTQYFSVSGTLTLNDLYFDFVSPYNLTALGTQVLLECLAGDYSSGFSGFDRIGIYGSINGGADQLIGTVKTPTYDSAEDGTLSFTTDVNFPIDTANTVIKKVMLFNSSIGTTLGYQLAEKTFDTYKTYAAPGTFTVDSLVYTMQ